MTEAIFQKLNQKDIPNSVFKVYSFLEINEEIPKNINALSKILNMARKTLRKALMILEELVPEILGKLKPIEFYDHTVEVKVEFEKKDEIKKETTVTNFKNKTTENKPLSTKQKDTNKSFEERFPVRWAQFKQPMKNLINQFEEKEFFTEIQFKYINNSIEHCKKNIDDFLDDEAILNLLTPSLKQAQKDYKNIKDLWLKTIDYLKKEFPGSDFYEKQIKYSKSRYFQKKRKEEKEKNNVPNTRYKEIEKLFKKLLPGLMIDYKKSGELTNAIKNKIKRTWMEYHDLKEWEKAFKKVKNSDFFMKNPEWFPDFEWIVDINNFRKILNGKYDDKKPINNSQLTERYAEQNLKNNKSNKFNLPSYIKQYTKQGIFYVDKLRKNSNNYGNDFIEHAIKLAEKNNLKIHDTTTKV